MRPTQSPHLHRGFTLLEILVAFAIGVASLGVILRIMGQGSRMVAVAERYQQAVFIAENLLDEALVPARFPIGSHQGRIRDTYAWEVRIADLPAAATDQPNLFPLQRIDIAITWAESSRDRELALHSLRPAPISQ